MECDAQPPDMAAENTGRVICVNSPRFSSPRLWLSLHTHLADWGCRGRRGRTRGISAERVDGDVIRTVGLTKVFEGRGAEVRAVDGLDLTVRAGRDLRAARPERRGQDHDRRDAHDPGDPDRAATRRSAGSTSSRTRPLAKQVIGVVPQTNTLDRSLDVYENLYFHGRYFGMKHRAKHTARPTRLLETVPARRPGPGRTSTELSGGMAQRLMVARAIMHDPDVLFLDEPTSGLDPQSRIALWDVVRRAARRTGQTIVLTTHYMEEADQLCERVAIIDHGKLLALDTPAQPEGDGRRRHRGAHPGLGRSRRTRRATSSSWTASSARA